MPTIIKNAVVKNIGTEPTLLLETDLARTMTIIGLSLTNVLDTVTYVDVTIKTDESVEVHFLKNTLIPFNSSLRAVSSGEKLVLGYNDQLYVVASKADSVDAIVSYAEVIQ